MKWKAIILVLFILLLNVNPPIHGRAAAGTEGAWEPLNNPIVPGGEVELLAQSSVKSRYPLCRFGYPATLSQIPQPKFWNAAWTAGRPGKISHRTAGR